MVLESNQLPDDAESLKQSLLLSSSRIDHLQEMVRLLQNEIFGRKSEVRPVIDPNQLQLFTPTETVEPVQPDESIAIKGMPARNVGVSRCPRTYPGSKSSTICRKRKNIVPAGPR
jgi:hypothetical protein